MQAISHVIILSNGTHVHFHQLHLQYPSGITRRSVPPLFSVLVKLSYLVLVEGKRSIIDRVMSFDPPPSRWDDFFHVKYMCNGYELEYHAPLDCGKICT